MKILSQTDQRRKIIEYEICEVPIFKELHRTSRSITRRIVTNLSPAYRLAKSRIQKQHEELRKRNEEIIKLKTTSPDTRLDATLKELAETRSKYDQVTRARAEDKARNLEVIEEYDKQLSEANRYATNAKNQINSYWETKSSLESEVHALKLSNTRKLAIIIGQAAIGKKGSTERLLEKLHLRSRNYILLSSEGDILQSYGPPIGQIKFEPKKIKGIDEIIEGEEGKAIIRSISSAKRESDVRGFEIYASTNGTVYRVYGKLKRDDSGIVELVRLYFKEDKSLLENYKCPVMAHTIRRKRKNAELA